MKITVYGGASPFVNQKYLDTAYELGKELAKRGHSLVYGGGARGLMGAVARGVHEEQGHILGISPRIFETVDGELFEKCNEFIFTDSMRERKFLLEENGDAFVVTPGGAGTFEELFEAFTLKQLQQHNKAIVIFNMDGYYNTMHQLLNEAIEQRFIREANLELFVVLNTVQEVLDYLENYKPKPLTNKYRG